MKQPANKYNCDDNQREDEKINQEKKRVNLRREYHLIKEKFPFKEADRL
ncbi:hypothetical protein [Sediminibacterium goheungense]|nr:hypothetical protein [Sediminibacterium goheungense]